MTLQNDFALAQQLRLKLRDLEKSITLQSERRPHVEGDDRRNTQAQARYDSAYVAAGRRAPPPLPLESPHTYERRLANDLRQYAPKFADVDFNVMPDDAFKNFDGELIAEATRNAPTHGLAPGEMRQIDTVTGGRTKTEWVGGPDAWFGHTLSPPPRRAILPTLDQARQMTRDAQLARLTEFVPFGAQRAAGAP